MVRFKNRYILVEIETPNEESINDISSYDLLIAIRDSISSNYGDLGAAKTAFFQVKYYNAAVRIAIIRVARDYISMLANSITFVTQVKSKSVKLRQLRCSGTIKKMEIKAVVLLNVWLNNALKKVSTNPTEMQEIKTLVDTEIENLSKLEQ